MLERIKGARSIDIQRKKALYTATMRTDKDEQIIINVENHPGKDAVRLEAEKDVNRYLSLNMQRFGGYAAQYYLIQLLVVHMDRRKEP